MKTPGRDAVIRAVSATLLMVGLFASCSSPPGEEDVPVDAWMALYEDRDFFRLRDELRTAGPVKTPRVQFLRAVVQHAFNRPIESNTTLEELLPRDDVPGSLLKDAMFLRLNNLVRLYRYADAAGVAGEIVALDDSVLEEEERNNADNTRKLMEALADVAPQETVVRDATVLDYGADGRISVQIDGTAYRIPLDTGANLSMLMRSEVERLGLRVRPAGIKVGTSTDMKVHADLTVADRVEIGNIEYRHVVFLVFPDELLTFPDGHVIEGVIGFPLIEAMGEVRFRRDGSLEIPDEIPERDLQNLALHQLEPLVRVGYRGDGLVCRLDTGADDTSFYEPFFRRYPALFESLGEPETVKAAGVGGIRTLAAYMLPSIEFELGGLPVTMEDVEVYTSSITDEESNDLHCNIGRTALADFEEYAINFRSMALTAR